MFNFPKFIITVAAMVIMTVVSASEMSAQNQNYFAPVKTQDVFNHFVQPGESCELIARKYYLVEDASLLLSENPWLANRPVWGRNGVISYRIHPGEVIRIKFGQQPVYLQPQQPIQILENSFMSTPAFWIGFGFLTLMLIVLSIIVGILWGGRRGGMQQAPAPGVMHHTHTHTHRPMNVNMNVDGHITHEQVGVAPGTQPAPVASPAPAGPDAPAGGGVQNQGARSPVGFKPDKECGQGGNS